MSKCKSTKYDLLIYPTHLLTCFPSHHKPNPNKAPRNNDTEGSISAKAARRLKKAVRWMDAMTPYHWEKNPATGTKFRMKLNFITLTLCSEQMHTDQQIKSKMLHPWITNICKQYKLKWYVWRAEPQKNGNIHFHFVTNKFMNLYHIRRAWNACQKRMGYIAKYREAQQQWHKDGFKPRPWLYKHWSKEAQLKSFKHGNENNWSDPNSTDIHSLQNVKDAAAYISKYMTKNITATCNDCGHTQHYEKYPSNSVTCKKCSADMAMTENRQIKGRLWYISQSLSQIKPLRVSYTGHVDAELYIANGWKSEGIEICPYATLYLIRPSDIPSYAGTFIKSTYEKFCSDYYNAIEGITIKPPDPIPISAPPTFLQREFFPI